MIRARPIRTAALAVVLAGGWTVPAAAQDPESGSVVQTTLAEVLADPSSDRAASLERLAALGTEALPALAESLGRERPGSSRAGLLAEAIGARPFPAFEEAVRAWLRSAPHPRERLGVLRGLGRLGGEHALALAVALVAGMEPAWLLDHRSAVVWEDALGGILTRDTSRRVIAQGLRSLPHELEVSTARALARLDRPEALAALVDLVEADPDHAGRLLHAMDRVSLLAFGRVDMVEVLRRSLLAGDASSRAAAAARAEKLGLHVLVPDLVDALVATHGREQQVVGQALRGLTGIALGSDPAAWHDWIEAQTAWWSEGDVLQRLEAEAPEAVAQALREMADRPFASASAASQVIGLLAHAHPGVRVAAAATLRALRHLHAVPGLVATLADEDAEVRASAHLALVALTDERVGPDVDAWRALLRKHAW